MKPLGRTIGAILMLASALAVPSRARGEETDSKALFREGAKLWPETCGSCHQARPGSEHSAAEWDVIMMHMRVIANLPARQERAILTYLKAH